MLCIDVSARYYHEQLYRAWGGGDHYNRNKRDDNHGDEQSQTVAIPFQDGEEERKEKDQHKHKSATATKVKERLSSTAQTSNLVKLIPPLLSVGEDQEPSWVLTRGSVEDLYLIPLW